MAVEAFVQVSGIEKAFMQNGSTVQALGQVSFQVAPGEFVALVGPSGCGKSTLLRILGGLLAPDSGSVVIDGRPLNAPRREIGFVFQRANLMPWRTVLDNIALPLQVQGMPPTEARREAQRLSDLVGLQGFEAVLPHQLSGGMQQRAALARALIHHPRLLLLDEPFGALDALTRERMNFELLRIWQLHASTVILVTHSISEAVLMSDRVMVMGPRPGRIITTLPVPLSRPRHVDLLADEHFAALVMAVRRWIDQAGQGQLWPGPPSR
jgi:NitT/TauT family transport system ATP-binding protein